MSAIIVLILYVYKQKQNNYLNTINVLNIDHENAILKAQIEIQEQTFQNISQDIHDNIGQKLSLVKLQLVNIGKNNSVQISDITATIGHAIDDLRNLSRALSSDIILENGLTEAIRYEVTQLEKTNLFEIDYKLSGETVFLDGKRELIVFRIIQEGIQNIVKHAKASRVFISAEYKTDNIVINIEDNGIGFKDNNCRGQGLINIRSRAILLGGHCEISARPEKGTSLNLIIPINAPIETN